VFPTPLSSVNGPDEPPPEGTSQLITVLGGVGQLMMAFVAVELSLTAVFAAA
jgi:hypothetical protein